MTTPVSATDHFNFKSNAYDGLSAVNGLIVDGAYVDGSWELHVHVEDVGTDVIVRVRGDLSLGGLMHRVVEAVDFKQSWSDHAIWWPQRNMWLLHTRTSLDKYGVQSDAKLIFRRMHGCLQVILPSLLTVLLRVNYASRVFSVVDAICKQLSIRHPEELSLLLPYRREQQLKFNSPLPVIRHGTKNRASLNAAANARTEMSSAHSCINGALSVGQLNVEAPSQGNSYPTLPFGSTTLLRSRSDNSLDVEAIDITRHADCGQRRSAKPVFTEGLVLKPKNITQKARLDGNWLDSSRSLMEHGIEPATDGGTSRSPALLLRFKYCSFYDINVNYDAVRIHQLFEQARWSLLAGCMDCTEDEMVAFAAYQLQAELQTEAAAKAGICTGFGTLARYGTLGGVSGYSTMYSLNGGALRPMTPDPSMSRKFALSRHVGGSLVRLPTSVDTVPSQNYPSSGFSPSFANQEIDEIDEMLSELEQSCNVCTASATRKSSNPAVILHRTLDSQDSVNSFVLQDTINIFRDRVLFMRRYKEMFAVVKYGKLLLFRDSHNTDNPITVYGLKDCIVTPDMNHLNRRYSLKLSVGIDPSIPSSTLTVNGKRGQRSREELWFKFSCLEQYAKWMAAFRLASRNISISSQTMFDREVEESLKMLRNQSSKPASALISIDAAAQLNDLSDFCAERIIKRANVKDLRKRIVEAQLSLRELSLLEAKLRYIQDWQRLNNFGRAYFIVQIDKGSYFGPSTGSSGSFPATSSSSSEMIIAVRQGRIEIVCPTTEDTMVAWNFTDLRSWNVNWDNGRVILEFRDGRMSFKPLSANCKTVVEFIGGYVFLSQRTPEKNQKIDERLYHKLTGAND